MAQHEMNTAGMSAASIKYESSDEYEDTDDEDVPAHLLDEADCQNLSKRLIMAIDFGTTFSAVSYLTLEKGESTEDVDINRIRSIQNFPKDFTFAAAGDHMRSEVPTEVIYPLDWRFRKTAGLSTDEDRELSQGEEDLNENVVEEDAEGDIDDDSDTMMIDDQSDMDEPDSGGFMWGYEVHEAWNLPTTYSDPDHRDFSRFKLLLDESPETKAVRLKLGHTLRMLMRRKVIKKQNDIITDYLTCLLRHTKRELENKIGLDDSYSIETVLCVPAIWSQKACRIMQTALAKAMKRNKFGGVDVQNNSIESLFIVSEPEAAAAFVLAATHRVAAGDTFVLLDAGGGTVDANTYTVSTTMPLRLAEEAVPPSGGLHGSSYLNEDFSNLLHSLLDDEAYLKHDGVTIPGIVESTVVDMFEHRVKRTFDINREKKGWKMFKIPNLRPNPQKSLYKGYLKIPTEDIKKIFLKRLEAIAEIMMDQINGAIANGKYVKEVLLIGGFGSSISLRQHLKERLESLNRERGTRIILIPEADSSIINPAIAVASGAVLRALNKDLGPQRYSRSSYGILRREPFLNLAVQQGLRKTRDAHTGKLYIETIDWILPLGATIGSVWECSPFSCEHTFDWDQPELKARELLYVSDKATESHLTRTHPNNSGAELVGEIVTDFTFLRDKGELPLIEPKVDSDGVPLGMRHYRVRYKIKIKVVDRDLRCYALFKGAVLQRSRINIASSFTKKPRGRR